MGFGGRHFMGTYSLSPRRVSVCTLHAGSCGTPREWPWRPTAMRRVSSCMSGKKPVSPSSGAGRRPSKATSGVRRWAVARALHFAELLEEDGLRLEPASYVRTAFPDNFEEMVRTHGSSPTSSLLLCSLSGNALGLPHGADLDFPRPSNGERQPVTTMRFPPRTPFARRTLCSDSKIDESKDLQPTSGPRVCGGPRLHVGGSPDEVIPRGPKCAGRR